MSRNSLKQGSREFLHLPAVLTRLPASTDASASPDSHPLEHPLGWHCQRLASPCQLPSRSSPRRAGIEAARPHVHAAKAAAWRKPASATEPSSSARPSGSAREEGAQRALLPNVPWSTRTLVSWLGRLRMMYPRRAQMHPLQPGVKVHFSPYREPMKLSNARLLTSSLRCSCVSRRTVLTCMTPPGVPIKCASNAECRPNQTPVLHRGSYLCVIRSASNQ